MENVEKYRAAGAILDEAMKFNTISRQRMRSNNFRDAMEKINAIAGGEPRTARRLMARAKAKR